MRGVTGTRTERLTGPWRSEELDGPKPERKKRGPKPGLPRVGGRAVGTLNKRTIALQNEQIESGLMPLGYMLKVLRDESRSDEDHKWAATTAAPYLHPRLQPIVPRDDQGKPIDEDQAYDIREIARRLALIFTRADPGGAESSEQSDWVEYPIITSKLAYRGTGK